MSEIKTVAKARIDLLEKKHTTGLSEDEEQQLQVLNEKMNKLSPRVTEKELEVLKQIERALGLPEK